MNADDIVAALGGRNGMARCPAHDDKNPSLSVTDKDGKVLVHCFAGCPPDAVIDALRTRGLWSSNGAHRARRVETQRTPDAETTRKHAEAAVTARALWHAGIVAGEDHPYLTRKGVRPVTTLRELPADRVRELLGYVPRSAGEPLVGRILIASVMIGDNIATVEMIDAEGRKSALAGGAKKGGFWAAQKMPDGNGDGLMLLIGEGVATVLSASEATGHCGVAALSAGNLAQVAKAMRTRYPAADLVILADVLKATGAPDPKAIEAAGAVGARLALPAWAGQRPEGMTDMNDLGVSDGAEAVRRCITEAQSVTIADTGVTSRRSADIVCLSDVHPEAVIWLWEPYIPCGKLTLLEGDPSIGKTFVALAWASIASRGNPWPDAKDGSLRGRNEPADVLYMTAEDGLADTIRPRLDAMGADVSRIHCLVGGRGIDGTPCGVSLSDLDILGAALTKVRPVLLIVDPIQAFLGAKVDMHRANEVRPILAGLSGLAEKHGCAVVAIRHLAKGRAEKSMYKGLGSIDFTAAARSVLIAAKESGDTDARAIVHLKSSCAPPGASMGYKLTDGKLQWTGKSEMTAATATAPEATCDENSAMEEAGDWLQSELSHGPRLSADLHRSAHAAGIASRTLRRAANRLGVHKQKQGFGPSAEVTWSIPDTIAAKNEHGGQDIPLAPMDEFGPYVEHPL